jgi:MPBQ/MSBQ methyltransferase
MDQTYSESLNAHYGSGVLADRIEAALRAAGTAMPPAPDDLAPLDQFHSGGMRTTKELAERLNPKAGQTIIDVGGGIGGPARTLATLYGCSVTVVDLTESFCEAGERLTKLVGLSDLVTFRHGNALDLPFANESFDLGWTQHATMNIDDKERLYGELHRVIRPGGRLALHEILTGENQPVHFPVPWSREPELSFLRPVTEMRALIASADFEEIEWVDTTESAIAWFQGMSSRQASSPPSPLGIHVLLGPEFSEMARNLLRNLEEGRIAVVQAVFERG